MPPHHLMDLNLWDPLPTTSVNSPSVDAHMCRNPRSGEISESYSLLILSDVYTSPGLLVIGDTQRDI